MSGAGFEQRALGRRIEEMDAITNQLPAVVAYVDSQGRYLHANETYRTWLGVAPESILGRPVARVVAEALGESYWQSVRPAFERALAGEAVSVEAEGRFADRYRHVETYYTPDRDETGRVRGVVCLAVDVTELKHRAMLLDQAMEPVFTWRIGGPITYWNYAAEQLYGYTREEAVGQVSHELLRTSRPEPAPEFEARLMREKTWSGELTHVTKDGRIVTVDSIHWVVDYGAGPTVLETNRDITEKRQAQDRLRRAIAASGVGLWEADADGTLTASENVEDLFGAARGTARRWEDLRSRVIESDRSGLDAQYRRAVETGEPLECDFRVDAGGGARWLHVQARASVDGARISGAVMDISGHKAAQEELKAMTESLERRVGVRTRELEELNRELESFSYSVSHDLRAPLRSVEGFGELLMQEYADRKLDAEGMDYLRRMKKAGLRMGQLIDDLLKLSRIGRAPLQRRDIDLSAMAEEIVAAHRVAEPEREARVRVQPGLRAWADPGLTRVVLENLLSNAWKYSGKESCARIEFGEMESAGERAFYVRDNGVGFDMRHAEHLFAPFQRLHRAADFEGTGVGLATVQRIVRRHQGGIWAEAKPKKGATFYFTLGAADGEENSTS